VARFPHVDNPNLWRARAEEARARAEQRSTPEARDQFLMIAKGYDRLAEMAEARIAATKEKAWH
jgi:hypothetical protein